MPSIVFIENVEDIFLKHFDEVIVTNIEDKNMLKKKFPKKSFEIIRVGSNIDFDIGVTGFWNFALETVFTIFTVAFLMLAVLLTAGLAVVSYPLAAFLNYGYWVFKNTKNPVDDSPIIIKQSNDQEKK